MMSYAFITINSQDRKFAFFGSYNYGIGNLTAKENLTLLYPFADEAKKLKSGTIDQIELGILYHSFGLGIIHNTYVTYASTNYNYPAINGSSFMNGTLSDKLILNFTGLELLYKIPVFSKRFDLTCKIGIGLQSYTNNKDNIDLRGLYPSHDKYTLTGNNLTTMAGVEINYQLWKILSIGIETSVLPSGHTKLTDTERPSYYSYSGNDTRLSTGLKIKITI